MANFSASSVHGTKTTAGVLNFLLSHVYHTGHSFSFTTEAAMQRILCFVCNNTTQQQSFYGPLSRTTRRTRVSRYQKKHSPTHHPEHHPIFFSFFHLLRSNSLFKLRAWQSFDVRPHCRHRRTIQLYLPCGTNVQQGGHIGATRQIRSNLCFLQHTRVHSPNGKSIGSAVSAQVTAESAYTLQWGTLSPKIAPSHGWIGTPSISWFLEPDRAHNPNCIMIRSAIFAQVTAECPYIIQWAPLSPKIAPSHCGSGPHVRHNI